MLELVAVKEMSSGEIAEHFNVTRQAISQHLGVLKDVGLVQDRREGRRRLYRTRAEGIAILRQYFNDLWSSSLALAADLDDEDEYDTSHPGDAGELSPNQDPGPSV